MNRRTGLAALAALAAMLGWAYAAIFQAPASGMYHDDAVYLVLARSLAEGEGYRVISLPDAPVQTKYPILFPFLLSLVVRVTPAFPDNLLWLRTIPLAATGAWLYLSWHLLRRCGSSSMAALMIVALTAASPAVAYFANTLLAETLFAALLTGSLLGLTAARDQRPGCWRLCAIAGALAGASVLTRTPGIAVILGGLGWLLTRRRWADAAAFTLAAGVLVAPWVGWVATHMSPLDPYYSASVYGAGSAWNIVFSYDWPEKLVVLRRNLEYFALTPVLLWGQRPWLLIPCLLALPLVVRGLWVSRAHPVTWCVMLYLGILLVWVWPPSRLLVPVAPLLVWHVSLAVRGVARTIVAATGVVLLVSASVSLLQMARDAPTRVIGWPSQAQHPESWQRLEALYHWIRRTTPSDAVLAGELDPAYFLYTGRTAVRTFAPDGYSSYYDAGSRRDAAETVDVFRRRILVSGAGYWIWSEGPGRAAAHRRLRDDLSRTFRGSLSLAAGDTESGYAVYRIDRARLADPAGARR
jgi:hypothetical protein